ncbi:MAG: putative ABC transporter permease [Actinomycetota bacterium]|nr:putative ABC transporter permease [Actinomycetota bacterium]
MYAAAGFAFEVVFSVLHDLQRGRTPRFRTSPWMLTVYALLLPLYEPVHDRLRGERLPVRATVYGLGFLAVEYASGMIFRRTLGDAPWDYTYAKRHVNGLIRPDYFFLWALAGLLAERLHDELTAQ